MSDSDMDFIPDDTLPTATDVEQAAAWQYNQAVAILRQSVLGERLGVTSSTSAAFRTAYQAAAERLHAPVPVSDAVEEQAALIAFAYRLLPSVSFSAFRGDLYGERRDQLGRALTAEECERIDAFARDVWTARERVA